MIYLAGEPKPDTYARGQLVKIGHAQNDCAARVAEWQCGNPRTIELLAELEGDLVAERRVHRELERLRVRGEWFLLTTHMIRVARWKRIHTADEWLGALPEARDLYQDDYLDLVGAAPLPGAMELRETQAEMDRMRGDLVVARQDADHLRHEGAVAERGRWGAVAPRWAGAHGRDRRRRSAGRIQDAGRIGSRAGMSAFCLQNRVWAMLGSNQRPPPCRDGTAWSSQVNARQGKSAGAAVSSLHGLRLTSPADACSPSSGTHRGRNRTGLQADSNPRQRTS